jgi:hypothetical protein
LAFEYQGKHHYVDVYQYGSQWLYKERDDYKKMACAEKGITVIEIPFYWDFEQESLRATIQQHSDLII